MKKILLLTVFVMVYFSLLSKNVYARSGCCSHHGGVCGCGCCDGTPLSSTCAPYYPECSQPVYIAPVVTKAPATYTPKPSTPVPSTPKPTIRPTQTPTIIPTVKPSSIPTPEPEVKSAAIENEDTSTSTVQLEKTEVNTKDALIGLGIFTSMVGGLTWIITKIIKKIISIFRK